MKERIINISRSVGQRLPDLFTWTVSAQMCRETLPRNKLEAFAWFIILSAHSYRTINPTKFEPPVMVTPQRPSRRRYNDFLP